MLDDGLLKKLESGNLPHYTVPHTLASLAYANAFGLVPYLKKILGVMIPLLNQVKTDTLKQAFAFGKKIYS